MTHDADILIVGGGLNGPALALAAAQAGLTSALIDTRPDPARAERGFDGRAYALAAASIRLLTALDVWPQVADLSQPILQVKASDGRAGQGASPFFLHFDAAELEDGQMGAMLEDRFLYTALRDATAAHPAITRHPGQTVVAQDITPAAASVTLASGATLTGRLIVGCDGRQSGTATRAGLRRTGWAYDQTALVTAIEHDRPHHGIAHQFFMPEGPLAILPLPGNRSQLVWTETEARAAAIQALPDAEYLAALAPRIGDFLGDFRLAGDRFTYPLSLSLAERWVAPRLALAGDAAHGVHPIAGQGLNLGLRDVAALAETLAHAHRRGEDIGAVDVLTRYQTWRRFDTTAMALGMDSVNRLFSNDNPILRPLRDLGMGIVTATPTLRRAFMRRAAGLTGNTPQLLRGLPL
ncbi:MAG: FAD-dependent monooxygenase [Gemmobacter sp.]